MIDLAKVYFYCAKAAEIGEPFDAKGLVCGPEFDRRFKIHSLNRIFAVPVFLGQNFLFKRYNESFVGWGLEFYHSHSMLKRVRNPGGYSDDIA